MPKAKLAKKPERWSQAIAVGRWLRRRAENVSALLLLAMFLCFILQIAARYLFNRPLGWTDEVSVLIREDGRTGLVTLPKVAEGTRWGISEHASRDGA